MPTMQRHRFAGPRGALAAIIDRPDDDPLAHAVFAHCFTCSKDVKAAYFTCRALALEGIAVLRFDFSGLGDSEGDFGATTFSSHVEDVLAAARFLRETYQAPRLLIGHSLGGTAALAAAGQVPEARAVVTIASPLEPLHLRRHLEAGATSGASHELEPGSQGLIPIQVAGRSFSLGRQFFEELSRHDLKAVVGQLGRALLVCHAPDDRVVDPAEARRIYDAAAEPRSLVSLPGAGHLLLDRAQGAYLGRLIAAWARPYLDEGPTDE